MVHLFFDRSLSCQQTRFIFSHVLKLEDDVIAKVGFVSEIISFVNQTETNPNLNRRWYTISFSSLGFIAKLFRSSSLDMFISVFLIFAELQPIDLAWDIFIKGLVCDVGIQQKCKENTEIAMLTYSTSLFQHMGVKSSLKGKIQNLKVF